MRMWILSLALAVLTVLAGCKSEGTRVDLTTFDEQGRPERHYADFSGATYRMGPGDTFELALQSQRSSTIDPTQTIRLVVYVKSFWTPRPGTTFAEATQINARVRYAILTPPTGVRYDGAAFVDYRLDRQTGELTGKIESGSLAPRARMGNAVEPFGPARLTGTFRAREQPSQVVKVAQMLEAQFTQPITTE